MELLTDQTKKEEIIIPIIVTDGEPEQLGKTNLPTLK